MQAVLDGEVVLTRFLAVTRHEHVVYVKPGGESLEAAIAAAVRHADDDIHAELPLAVVDLECGNTHRPDWTSLRWVLPWEQIPVPARPVKTGGRAHG
jgi:hypothetical protein